MKIIIIAGMIDAKLASKIQPLQQLDTITQIHLLRRNPYRGEKIISHHTPGILKKLMPVAECWRFLTLLYLCIRFKPAFLLALGTVPHGVYAWIVGKLFHLPVIQHVMGKNDLRLTFKKSLGKKITLKAVKSAAAIGVRGILSADYLIKNGVTKEQLFIPQNLHDFDLFRPDPGHAPEYDLIYVGLLSAYKRLDLMIDALAIVVNERPETTLLIIGDGPLKQPIIEQIKRLKLSANIKLRGNISYQQLPRYFIQAKIFIMTSQGEGLPMAMIEALSCGLPVIVPDDADITTIAKDHHNALVAKQWLPDAFADAIVTLLNDPDLYHTLQAGALTLRNEKEQAYSLEFQAQLWQKTINRIL